MTNQRLVGILVDAAVDQVDMVGLCLANRGDGDSVAAIGDLLHTHLNAVSAAVHPGGYPAGSQVSVNRAEHAANAYAGTTSVKSTGDSAEAGGGDGGGLVGFTPLNTVIRVATDLHPIVDGSVNVVLSGIITGGISGEDISIGEEGIGSRVGVDCNRNLQGGGATIVRTGHYQLAIHGQMTLDVTVVAPILITNLREGEAYASASAGKGYGVAVERHRQHADHAVVDGAVRSHVVGVGGGGGDIAHILDITVVVNGALDTGTGDGVATIAIKGCIIAISHGAAITVPYGIVMIELARSVYVNMHHSGRMTVAIGGVKRDITVIGQRGGVERVAAPALVTDLSQLNAEAVTKIRSAIGAHIHGSYHAGAGGTIDGNAVSVAVALAHRLVVNGAIAPDGADHASAGDGEGDVAIGINAIGHHTTIIIPHGVDLHYGGGHVTLLDDEALPSSVEDNATMVYKAVNHMAFLEKSVGGAGLVDHNLTCLKIQSIKAVYNLLNTVYDDVDRQTTVDEVGDVMVIEDGLLACAGTYTEVNRHGALAL